MSLKFVTVVRALGKVSLLLTERLTIEILQCLLRKFIKAVLAHRVVRFEITSNTITVVTIWMTETFHTTSVMRITRTNIVQRRNEYRENLRCNESGAKWICTQVPSYHWTTTTRDKCLFGSNVWFSKIVAGKSVCVQNKLCHCMKRCGI